MSDSQHFSSDDDSLSPVNNSPTLIGAAVGTVGGPIWALVGTGVANVYSGFRDTDWNTLNVSAAMLLFIVNGALLVMSLVVASRCVAAGGGPSGYEFAAALVATTPYVVYRAFSPCRPPSAFGAVGALGASSALGYFGASTAPQPPPLQQPPVDFALGEALPLAPAALVRIGGGGRK